VAFLLSSTLQSESLASVIGLDPAAPTVACSISGGIVSFAGVDHERHIGSWVRCITHLVDKVGAQVLLVPHVQEVSVRNDDRLFATEILRRLDPKTASRVRLAGGELRATEYKALISRCDLLIAERMHAAIAGLSTAVPTLVVGYSVKARGILLDVMGSETKANDQLIAVSDFCNADLALERVLAAWQGRGPAKQVLEASKARMKEAALKNFSSLLEVAAGRQ
jgi:colanic acid/amylovoran biosynthesis protein